VKRDLETVFALNEEVIDVREEIDDDVQAERAHHADGIRFHKGDEQHPVEDRQGSQGKEDSEQKSEDNGRNSEDNGQKSGNTEQSTSKKTENNRHNFAVLEKISSEPRTQRSKRINPRVAKPLTPLRCVRGSVAILDFCRARQL